MDIETILPILLMNGISQKTVKEMIMYLIVILMPYLSKLKNINYSKFRPFKKKECEYILSAEIRNDKGKIITNGYCNNFIIISNCLTEFLRENNILYTINKISCYETIILKNGPVKMNDVKIDIKLTSDRDNTKDGYIQLYYYKMIITGKNHKVINEFINNCIKIIDERNRTNDLYICKTLKLIDSEYGNGNKIISSKYLLNTTKTFDSLFFAKKEILMNKLNDFMNNEERYKRLGIPYTLGLLFHGVPGNGKTSCIKAIAKYTKRNIIIVNPNLIQTTDDLIKLFTNNYISLDKDCSIHIPLHKRIYVFEEIDATDWKKIIRSRKLEPLKDDSDPEYELDTDNGSKVKIVKKNKDQLTLGSLLEILDGLIEHNSRIIIMTSNHPEEIDDALLRPGRIDYIIEFTNLLRKDIKDMYKLWFNKELDDNIYNNMKDYTYSQANIGKLFSIYDFDIIHKHLNNNTMCD